MQTINKLDLGDALNAPNDTVTIHRDGNNLVFNSPAAGTVNLVDFILPGGVHALTDHTDVVITAAVAGEVLRYSGAAWVDAVLDHADLGNVTSDQHHAEAHTIIGAHHTTLARGSIVRGSAAGAPEALVLGANAFGLVSDGFDAVWASLGHTIIGAHHTTLARGSIVRGSAAGAPEALALGANTFALLSDGNDAAWGTLDHTIASHDTTGTGANLTTLTDNSMGDGLHRHSELSASDGVPDASLQLDGDGNVDITGFIDVSGDVRSGGNVYLGYGAGAADNDWYLYINTNAGDTGQHLMWNDGLSIFDFSAITQAVSFLSTLYSSNANTALRTGDGGELTLDAGGNVLVRDRDAGFATRFSIASATGDSRCYGDLTVDGEIYGDFVVLTQGFVGPIILNAGGQSFDFEGTATSATKGPFLGVDGSIAGFIVNYDVKTHAGGGSLTVGVAVNGVPVLTKVVDSVVGAGKPDGIQQARGLDVVGAGDIITMYIAETNGVNVEVEKIQGAVAAYRD